MKSGVFKSFGVYQGFEVFQDVLHNKIFFYTPANRRHEANGINNIAALQPALTFWSDLYRQDPFDKLTNYWRLNGTWDDEINGDTLVAGDDVSFGTGKNGQAAVFTAPGTGLSYAHSPKPTQAGSWSISCWFQCSGSTGYEQLVWGTGKFETPAEGRTALIRNGAGALITYHYGQQVNSNTTPALNTWVNAVVTLTSNAVKTYLNGELKSTFGPTNTIAFTGLGISSFSEVPLGSFEFNGKIDDVGLYAGELTQAEVTALYNGGTGLFLPSDYNG